MLLVVVASALLAACAGGQETKGGELTVVGTEMAFDAPGRVPAGRYDVRFRNDGAVPHELAFRHPSGRFVARRSIGVGMSAVIPVTLEPGTYELGCFEPGHYEAGMYRLLVVDSA